MRFAAGGDDLQGEWEASGIQGAAGVRLPNGKTWVSPPEGAHHEPRVIYSVAKMFIAVALLRAADESALGLDDPIAAYLPLDLPDGVTIRRLLNHTSGVPDYGRLSDYHAAVRAHPGTPWTDEETLRRTLASGLDFEPGAEFAYSNVGYMLLRQLLDRVVQGGMRGALRTYIIEPLLLTGTRLLEAQDDLLGLPAGRTELLGEGIGDVRGLYHPQWVKHHTLASTVHDLLRFSDVLSGDEILSPERIREMLSAVDVAVRSEGFERPGYGLGVMIDRRGDKGELIVGHGGGGPGYGAALFQRQRRGAPPITAVVLSGRDGGSTVEQTALRLLVAAERPSDYHLLE